MGARNIPEASAQDFSEALQLIRLTNEIQAANVVAQMAAEIRWLRTIIHKGAPYAQPTNLLN